MRPLRWLLPLGWTALIAWGSTDLLGAPVTRGRLSPLLAALLPWLSLDALETLHWLFRKAGHVVEYAVLASLWAWALGGWRRAGALAVGTAFLDELHQATTFTREGSAADFLLDSASAVAALMVLRAGPLAAATAAATALLWAAAAGGTALIAIDLAAGAPARWLWLTTPAAWLALALRFRAGRPRP
jgi:VanZ family protein